MNRAIKLRYQLHIYDNHLEWDGAAPLKVDIETRILRRPIKCMKNEEVNQVKMYKFVTKQCLPIPLEEAWSFFSTPANLIKLTPEWMNIQKMNMIQNRMYPGMLIQYQIQPILGIPLHWVTEITQMKELEYFIDVQRFGPFRFWHHEHHFKEINGGVEMTDILYYALPVGVIGQIVHACSVKRQMKQVFDYRFQMLERVFPVEKTQKS